MADSPVRTTLHTMRITSIVTCQSRLLVATTYISNLDHLILNMDVPPVHMTSLKFSMGTQGEALGLQKHAANRHHVTYIAVEGFSLCSFVQIGVSLELAFLLLFVLCHTVRKIPLLFHFIFLTKETCFSATSQLKRVR